MEHPPIVPEVAVIFPAIVALEAYNNPMVGATVAVAVSVEEAAKAGRF